MKHRHRWRAAYFAYACLAPGVVLPAQVATSVQLVAEGGESLSFAMGIWADDFSATHPGCSVSVRLAPEDQAMTHLKEGAIQVAMLARDAVPEELDAFKAKWGYPPTRIALALDALVYVVNRGNPIRAMRVEALNSTFFENRTMGWPKDVLTWGDAGVTDAAWRDRRITRYFQPPGASSTGMAIQFFMSPGAAKFQERGGAPIFRPFMIVPDAMAMAETLQKDPAGVGMVTMVEVFASEKAIALTLGDSDVEVLPNPDSVASGAYPLAKFLYAYVNKDPKKGLDPTLQKFLVHALSLEGQQAVKAAGQAPLSKDIRALNLLKVTDRMDIPISTVR